MKLSELLNKIGEEFYYAINGNTYYFKVELSKEPLFNNNVYYDVYMIDASELDTEEELSFDYPLENLEKGRQYIMAFEILDNNIVWINEALKNYEQYLNLFEYMESKEFIEIDCMGK